MQGRLISIGEAAKILEVSIDTLRRWDKKGILTAFRVSKKGHRYYAKDALYLFQNDLFVVAEKWVQREVGIEPDSSLYCPTKDVFESRLVAMQHRLSAIENLSTPFSLIVAIAGEIGNNSFDHNLGNWRDLPGILFACSIGKKIIVLADRGQGILKTLQRIKPDLKTNADAVHVAFTEVISGRAPESRGNGLKYVRKIVTSYPLTLLFETGDAKLSLHQGDQALAISEKIPSTHGCIAVLHF